MDREHMAENDIDPENVIQTDRNGCLVTVYFAKERNDRPEHPLVKAYFSLLLTTLYPYEH